MIWIDAQMSPAIAAWITDNFSVMCLAVREVGLRDAEDREIFLEARKQSAIVMTKDSDFITLQNELGAPPKIIWITCGNTSNARLKEILTATLSDALVLLNAGEDLIEVNASS
jgi:predicted nuclease of predicted toxin-antitoxin system